MRKILYLEPDESWFLDVKRGTRQLLPGIWLIERAASTDSFNALLEMDDYDVAMLHWPEFESVDCATRRLYMSMVSKLLGYGDGMVHVILLPESEQLHLDAELAETISSGRIHVVPKAGFSEQLLLEKIYEISDFSTTEILVAGTQAHCQRVEKLLARSCAGITVQRCASLEDFDAACRKKSFGGYIIEYELIDAPGSERLVKLFLHHFIKPLLIVSNSNDVAFSQTLLGLIGHRQIDFLSGKHLDEAALLKLVHCAHCPILTSSCS